MGNDISGAPGTTEFVQMLIRRSRISRFGKRASSCSLAGKHSTRGTNGTKLSKKSVELIQIGKVFSFPHNKGKKQAE